MSGNGYYPFARLTQGADGNFYGTNRGSTIGAGYDYGTVFRLSVGLGSFVKILPHARKAGQAIKILGTNLTGAISVTFNGTAATFTVARPSLITTTVPSGATSGKIRVTIPNGMLLSGGPFLVLQ